jgi:hypothetical protein
VGLSVTFKATPFGAGPRNAWTFVALPPVAHAQLGGAKGRIAFIGFADNHPIRSSAMPSQGRHCFMFNKDMQKGCGKGQGDSITFKLKRDTAKRTVRTPQDLNKAMNAHPKAAAFWKNLSYSNRKLYLDWITGAKKTQTRNRRVAKAVGMLTDGKTL